jgi:hypothetical protein
MSLDIGEVLENWPFRHEEVVARRVLGDDGKEKVQLRLDLGLLQMEVSLEPSEDARAAPWPGRRI